MLSKSSFKGHIIFVEFYSSEIGRGSRKLRLEIVLFLKAPLYAYAMLAMFLFQKNEKKTWVPKCDFYTELCFRLQTIQS